MSGSRAPRRRVPREVGFVVGVLCILLGAFLALHPFSSLAVLIVVVVAALVVSGVGELAAGRPEDQGG